MITDTEYPLRPAFSLLTRILDEQASLAVSLPGGAPASYRTGAASAPNPSTAASGGLSPAQKGKLEATLQQYLAKYQNPKQADTIMRVQAELDETKVVLHKTIESVLERGEKLDNLVERSNALSAQSKMFYKTAKKVSLFFSHLCCSVAWVLIPRSKTRVASLCKSLPHLLYRSPSVRHRT
jgi:synaptobrevin family protein YKT6